MEEFAKILLSFEIKILVDVRSFPSSFTNPQFNNDVIGTALERYGIQYVWLQKLGGRRKGFGKNSRNRCWRNVSFRNYADYMETPPFCEGIKELLDLARKGAVAIMCAEALYWHCHRVMIADYLKSIGPEIAHILNEKHLREHEYADCARIAAGKLTYHEQERG
jgi:uncharacterized protein (DUF488 family)